MLALAHQAAWLHVALFAAVRGKTVATLARVHKASTAVPQSDDVWHSVRPKQGEECVRTHIAESSNALWC